MPLNITIFGVQSLYQCCSWTIKSQRLFAAGLLAVILPMCSCVGLVNLGLKLRSEIVWHRFFAVPAYIRHFRSYIAVRKLLV